MTASLEGKDPVMARATLAVEIISHEIAQRWRKRRIQGTGSPGRLGKNRHWRKRNSPCDHSTERKENQ